MAYGRDLKVFIETGKIITLQEFRTDGKSKKKLLKGEFYKVWKNKELFGANFF